MFDFFGSRSIKILQSEQNLASKRAEVPISETETFYIRIMKTVSSLFYILVSSMPANKILLCLTKNILPHNLYYKKQQLEKQKAHEQKDEWGNQIDKYEQLDDKVKFLWSSHQSHLENVLRLLFLCIYIYIISYFYFVSQKTQIFLTGLKPVYYCKNKYRLLSATFFVISFSVMLFLLAFNNGQNLLYLLFSLFQKSSFILSANHLSTLKSVGWEYIVIFVVDAHRLKPDH